MIHTLEADSIQLVFGGRTILSDIYLKCETGKNNGSAGQKWPGEIMPDEYYIW
jgi:hypothetical protein